MAITVNLYHFAKKINSTKQPSDSNTPTAYQCNLLEETSIQEPTFVLMESNIAASLSSYNYAQAFGRYYFIREVKWVCRRWHVSCQVDVLASYKDVIGTSTCYVLRSSNAFTRNVADALYPACSGASFKYATMTLNNWVTSPDLSDGTFVLGVVNSKANNGGGVSYYIMSSSQLAGLRAYMLGSIKDWENITDFSGDIAKAFIDPFQYVVSCIWFPFPIIGGTSENVDFGFWQSNITASPLVSTIVTYSGTLAQPIPDADSRGLWTRCFPFAEYNVICMPWGIIPLDTNSLATTAQVSFEISIDLISGTGILNIYRDSPSYSNLLESVSAQIGVQIQLSQITTDYTSLSSLGQMANKAIGAAVSAIASGVIGQDAGQIADAAKASLSKVSTSGNNGGRAALTYGGRFTIQAKFLTPVEENLSEKGRPYCKNVQLSNVPGYLEVMDGELDMQGTYEEKRIIKNFLESGFFYE